MIEFRAREDWTASRIALCVTMLEKPNVGASMFFDLSPEIAEKLAADLVNAVKRYRDLDKAAKAEMGPKEWKKGCRVRVKNNHHVKGTVHAGAPSNATGIVVLWDNPQDPGVPVMSAVDLLEVIE